MKDFVADPDLARELEAYKRRKARKGQDEEMDEDDEAIE